jgi:hypothetical protein
MGLAGDALARAILQRATATLKGAIDELIADYQLERATVVLVGGGGGAAALIPFAAEALGFEHRIARDAEVISPLGVALALVRDVVERTIVDPAPADLVRIRREAIDAAIRAGAAPAGIEVVVEVDRSRNRVRATASGASALAEGALTPAAAGEDERLAAARRALRAGTDPVAVVARTPGFLVVNAKTTLAIVDERAVVRLIVPRAIALATTPAQLEPALAAAIEQYTNYGDVGKVLPDLWVLAGVRIVELTGLTDADGALALAADEIAGLPDDTPLALVVVGKRA